MSALASPSAAGGARPAGGRERGDILRWGGAGLVVLGLHLGGVVWALRETPAAPADGPPPAIMMELAPLPEAVATDTQEIAPDETAAQPATAALDAPAEDVPPLEDVPDAADATPADAPPEEAPSEEAATAAADLPMLTAVEVPLPRERPKPSRRAVAKVEPPRPARPDKPVTQPRESRTAEASTAAAQAQAQVRPSTRTAAAQTASGLFAALASPASWQSRLMAHLERRKIYPAGARSRGETGTAYVRFRIDDDGAVLSAALARSSGSADLDGEVLALVRRASPVPAPPPGANRTITAPVQFSIR